MRGHPERNKSKYKRYIGNLNINLKFKIYIHLPMQFRSISFHRQSPKIERPKFVSIFINIMFIDLYNLRVMKEVTSNTKELTDVDFPIVYNVFGIHRG